MRGRRGFTLIELLVVIAIIAVLTAVVVVALNSARAKGRDTSRIAAVHEIQSALVAYQADTGAFPPAAFPTDLSTALTSALVPNYIKAINFDLTNVSGATYYAPGTNPQSYLIYVSYEHQTQALPVSFGCRTGVGPVVDSGLYSTSPRC